MDKSEFLEFMEAVFAPSPIPRVYCLITPWGLISCKQGRIIEDDLAEFSIEDCVAIHAYVEDWHKKLTQKGGVS